MARKIYIFDRAGVRARKAPLLIWKTLLGILRIILISVSLFIVLYLILSLVLSTDTEKRLRRENRMYERIYPTLQPKTDLIGDVITGLQIKDGRIYNEVFHNEAPNIDPMSTLSFLFGADTIPDTRIVSYSSSKLVSMSRVAKEISGDFEAIYRKLGEDGFALPPMAIPTQDLSYPQIGAATGKRLNPFYKADVPHRGLDIIVPQGSPVYAPAAGTVVSVVRSSKGDGNSIEIEHAGGYTTRYLHLTDILVNQGQTVAKGRKIGTVGMSGNAFAPHLHYEVLHFGEVQNPVNHLFGSVDPDDYANMLYMSINTRQSMD